MFFLGNTTHLIKFMDCMQLFVYEGVNNNRERGVVVGLLSGMGGWVRGIGTGFRVVITRWSGTLGGIDVKAGGKVGIRRGSSRCLS